MKLSHARAMRMAVGIVQVVLICLLTTVPSRAQRGDLRLPLPTKTRATPVQQLNRDGVKELKRGHVKKAKQHFVKAYLLDPDDPFTLNNLGYIAEIEGDIDRALKYYQLAANTSTEAVIDEASRKGLKGQSVNMAFQSSNTSVYQGNKANFQAMTLLEKGRVFEAERVLKEAIQSNPKNPFLLDSLGFVMESEGDLQAALQYYTEAANLHSDERVLLTPQKKWRGKTITEIAEHNAVEVRQSIEKGEDTAAQVARLNLRGVAALNHNDASDARKFFADAYQIDPQNAFTLNNLGYIDELSGDRETAEMYYEAARVARQANERVTYATRADAEGRRVGPLAETNQDAVEVTLKAIQQRKRQSRRPVQLIVRSNGVLPASNEPKQPPPIGVPTPPLPPPRLPDRDIAPQDKQPSAPPSEPQIQPSMPTPPPPQAAGQAPVTPQGHQ
jgi:Flp pilus assembly protein TadD